MDKTLRHFNYLNPKQLPFVKGSEDLRSKAKLIPVMACVNNAMKFKRLLSQCFLFFAFFYIFTVVINSRQTVK